MCSLNSEDVVEEARRTVEAARERGIILRLMGATAFRVHCPKFQWLQDAMKRELTDIDLAGYVEQDEEVLKLFRDLNYPIDERKICALRIMGKGERLILRNPNLNCTVDVFFDRLEMSHTVEFKGRLQKDYPTIPLAELLLEKMQIHEINEKDIKDSIMLLREHGIGEEDGETINAEYIAELLAEDWGFYYTVVTNLEKVKSFLAHYDVLTQQDRDDVRTKIDRLLDVINRKPKTFGWRMRARVGTRKKWYRDVGETIEP